MKQQEFEQNELAKRLVSIYRPYFIGMIMIASIIIGILLYVYATQKIVMYYLLVLSIISFLKFVYSSEDIKNNLNKN